jgi:phytoene synthase
MSNEIESAYKYCESVTRTHAKSFYFAAKFLPKPKRRAVYPIYAFCRHVDDEIDEIGERGDESAAVRAVEKWKRQLEEVFENKKQTTTDANESDCQKLKTKNQNLVFTAWKDLLKTYRIPKNLPLELMQGVLMDTQIKRYETFDELYIYCYRVASTVGLMSSEILGYSDVIALRYAEALGVAMQLTNILRDVKEDAAMNRIYLPQEDLRKFEVSEQQIFSGDVNENFIELMKFQIARAREFYQMGEQGIRLLEKDSRFTVLLAARIYSRILDEIERQDYDVFARRASTTFSQKIFSLPKIWREAGGFKFQTSISASIDKT